MKELKLGDKTTIKSGQLGDDALKYFGLQECPALIRAVFKSILRYCINELAKNKSNVSLGTDYFLKGVHSRAETKSLEYVLTSLISVEEMNLFLIFACDHQRIPPPGKSEYLPPYAHEVDILGAIYKYLEDTYGWVRE